MKHVVSDNDSSNDFKSCSDYENDDEKNYFLFAFERDWIDIVQSWYQAIIIWFLYYQLVFDNYYEKYWEKGGMIYLIDFRNIIQMQMVKRNSSHFDEKVVIWITSLMISINLDKDNRLLPTYALSVNLRHNKSNTIMMNKWRIYLN